MLKTVEIIVDFRRNPPALPPLTIMNSTVTAVESFGFLGTTISQDLKRDTRLHCKKKPNKGCTSFSQLRKFNLPQELLKQFYSAIIESVLCTSLTVWFSSATKSDLRRLQRVVRTAERIIGTTLPNLLYLSRVSKKAGKITLDPSHPAHSLFELLPSGRHYGALSTSTTRHRNSFFPQAIHLMNIWTLNNKHETHNTIILFICIYFFIYHTYLLHFKFAPNIPVHTKLSILHIVCAILHIVHFVYLYMIFLLSVSCLVAVILSHCGATKQIPRMYKHTCFIMLHMMFSCTVLW